MLGLTVLLAGCSVGSDDTPNTAESPSSSPAIGGLDSYTFEGTGREITDPIELEGSYIVTWELSNNYTDTGLDGAFVVLLESRDVPFFEDLNPEYVMASEASESIVIEDLSLAGYFLNIATDDEAEWSVSFERQ